MTAPRTLDQTFDRCRQEGRAALIGYLPVGYPDVPRSLEAMRVLVAEGVDIVEIGIPYTDPMLDGPVIQDAANTALLAGTRVADAFTAARAVVEAGAVAVVMTYWNLILRRGPHRFAADLADAGGSGVILPDLTPEEAGEWLAAARDTGLATVFLVAPSSTPERLSVVTSATSGFVYAASVMGVTGTRNQVGSAARGLVERTKAITDLPVCVGLGVSTGAQAAEVASYADGVIVGSALVKAVARSVEEDPHGYGPLRAAVADLFAGVRSAR